MKAGDVAFAMHMHFDFWTMAGKLPWSEALGELVRSYASPRVGDD